MHVNVRLCACVRACVRACARVHARVCMRVCVCVVSATTDTQYVVLKRIFDRVNGYFHFAKGNVASRTNQTAWLADWPSTRRRVVMDGDRQTNHVLLVTTHTTQAQHTYARTHTNACTLTLAHAQSHAPHTHIYKGAYFPYKHMHARTHASTHARTHVRTLRPIHFRSSVSTDL